MTKTYYVLGNLKHNGHRYVRGEEITLTTDAAPALIAMGIVQANPVAPTAPVQEIVATAADTPSAPIVGGEPMKTGEPSIDGREEASSSGEAKEVGPHAPVSDAPTAPVQEAKKPVARAKTRTRPVEPENDPSANL